MLLRSGKSYGPPKSRVRRGKVVKITRKVRVRPMKMTQQAQVSTLVKRIISRDVENKGIGNLVETNVNHNSTISAADCLPLIPQIEQINVASSDTCIQRIGDKIKPKSLVVKGTVSIRTGSLVTNQNVYVRVLVLAQKNIKTGGQIASGGVDTNSLLRPCLPGVGLSEQPFNGFTVNLDMPINRDLFRVYYDRVHLLAGPGAAVAGPENPSGCYKWSYKFKSLPASLTFDNDNGDWANNFAPFYTVGYAYADGTSPDVTAKITTNCFSMFEFEDA